MYLTKLIISIIFLLLPTATMVVKAEEKASTDTISHSQSVKVFFDANPKYVPTSDTIFNHLKSSKYYFAQRPFFALKTNMLFDLLATPNVEIEIPVGKTRFSVMGEFWKPWFVWGNDRYAYQLQVLGGELRYWTTPRSKLKREQLTGTFFGAYYAHGRYDLQWKGVGDQGEFNSVGVTYGYSWPIARNLNIEASVSAGYLWGPRRHYRNEYDGHLIWKHTSTERYVGPTKLKISIVWFWGGSAFCLCKKGGRR